MNGLPLSVPYDDGAVVVEHLVLFESLQPLFDRFCFWHEIFVAEMGIKKIEQA